MPGYKTHINGALVAGIIILIALIYFGLYKFDPQEVCTLLIICVLGALFPDVDTDSKGKRLFYSGMLILDLALIYLKHFHWASYLGLLAILPGISAHRGWTHKWWAMFLVPLPVVVVPYYVYGMEYTQMLPYYFAFVFGYFTHLLLDREF